MIMEAEKSYSLLFSSWMPRKSGDVVPVQCLNWGISGISSRLILKDQETEVITCEGKSRWMSNSRTQKNFLFCFLVLFRSFQSWNDTHLHGWEWSLLSVYIKRLISSRNTFTDIIHNNVSGDIWISFFQLTHKIKIKEIKSWEWHKDFRSKQLEWWVCHYLRGFGLK
jgi:hypothetical protein